ncbi:ABC transporter substrate-binding protein [Ilumatobacter sp.]|uniref:ABC transporter substrate-binding protein n=1 Tax=Ilumatobacter sp. TaxID=1967498 RepID=UPI003B521127
MTRALAPVLALGLVAAACGSDGDASDEVDEATDVADSAIDDAAETADSLADDTMTDDTATDTAATDTAATDTAAEGTTAEGGTAAEGGGSGEYGGEPVEGIVEVGAGTQIDTNECPSDWSNTDGLEGPIEIGVSLPQSGQLAAFGAIGEGLEAYFDMLNESDPIDGKQVEFVLRDDAYDPARTQSNIEDMLETDDIGAFFSIIGTPNNAAVRPILDEECVPQLYNSTGFPAWGDPENFPWTIGGLLPYNTEADIWCEHITSELGEGATVAGLFMNNDFGAVYQDSMEACEGIELVESLTHEATAADISNELTTLSASDADAFVLGSTAAFCPQAMAGVAGSPWEPLFLMSNTCSSISSFFTPVDPAGQGVRIVGYTKEVSDEAFADDPAVQEARQVLEDAGIDPDSGSAPTGVIFALTLEQILREAAALPGGLTRTNIMAATWNLDFTNDLLREGVNQQTDGINDAYANEGGYIVEYQAPESGGNGRYETVSDLISVEGETGSVSQPGS